MIQLNPQAQTGTILYPESDGLPMSDNTKQFQWILVLAGNLQAQFRDDPNVFVGGNQNWYPVEGHPEICQAPDVYVVFGRPKGHRGSYQQWLEGGVPMTVVFEVLSPSNDAFEMADKLAFYDEHGVEEYYVIDPEKPRLLVYLRGTQVLRRQLNVNGFISPRLGIRFDLSGGELVIFHPDGRRFLTFEELEMERQRAEQRASQAEQRATQAEQRATQAEQRIARLAELSRKARQGQATVEELAELERLEEQTLPPTA